MDTNTDESEMQRLATDYAREWRVRRSYGPDGKPRGWVATRLVDDDLAPTVCADTLAGLEEQMRCPGPRYGRHLSSAQRAALLRELADPAVPMRPLPTGPTDPVDEDGIPVSWHHAGPQT
ncbi:hypothetical protein ACFOVU_16490 [Nocardiopsis sediminis]|uniref:DUF222 domain-containing protein n=1 Tax=Nocardiopsis sediminis TaxID=1778267 RepID=A0ABV8FS46_9ACTN